MPGSSVFLTGFMGSGKSTLGKALATEMRRPFVDLDEYVEARAGKGVREIFRDEGEQGFRRMETEALQSVTGSQTAQVIALGGGTLLSAGNLEIVRSAGLLVYLELSAKDLAVRLAEDSNNRPLIAGHPDEDLPLIIEPLLRARKLQYEQADITVNAINLTAQKLHAAIRPVLEARAH